MAPHRIGVAGYMGSGKSTCAAYLSRESGSVIDADSLAKDMMNSSPAIKKRLSESFGNGVVVESRIQFDFLGGVVFSSLQNLKELNSIVHPPRSLNSCTGRLPNAVIEHVYLMQLLFPIGR
jgi:dephospho-CoA kinase